MVFSTDKVRLGLNFIHAQLKNNLSLKMEKH